MRGAICLVRIFCVIIVVRMDDVDVVLVCRIHVRYESFLVGLRQVE